MHSRFGFLHDKAVALRKEGRSIREIEIVLQIPRSTLSGWFKRVSLTKSQKVRLRRLARTGLKRAQIEASKWHQADKAMRIARDKKLAEQTLKKLDLSDIAITELALAFLYLGEGGKTQSKTSLGSSNPHIAQFFLQCLQGIYKVPIGNIKCFLHLRSDQSPERMKRYWSKELELPLTNFKKSSIDKRTLGRPTYPHYRGVCVIECGRVEIQRRLMYIANGFCENIVSF